MRCARCWWAAQKAAILYRWDNWPPYSVKSGPAMIRDENAMLTGYVYLDLDGRDAEDYIAEAAGVLARKLSHARRVHAIVERPV